MVLFAAVDSFAVHNFVVDNLAEDIPVEDNLAADFHAEDNFAEDIPVADIPAEESFVPDNRVAADVLEKDIPAAAVWAVLYNSDSCHPYQAFPSADKTNK